MYGIQSRKFLDTSLTPASKYFLTSGITIGTAAVITGVALLVLNGSFTLSMPLLISGGGITAAQIFYIFCKKTGACTGILNSQSQLNAKNLFKFEGEPPNNYIKGPKANLVTADLLHQAKGENRLAEVLQPIIARWERRNETMESQHRLTILGFCNILQIEYDALKFLILNYNNEVDEDANLNFLLNSSMTATFERAYWRFIINELKKLSLPSSTGDLY